MFGDRFFEFTPLSMYHHLESHMLATNFEDLQIWQKAMDLYVTTFDLGNRPREYHWREQMNRASLSISNNIAEGFDSGYRAEFVRFLRIAKRSCAEVRSMVHAGIRIGFIPKESGMAIIQDCRHLSVMIHKFSKTLK